MTRAVPHPAVTLVIDVSAGRLVVDHAAGRERQGRLVVGLAFGALQVRGEGIESLQVRLSPVVAHAALGAPPRPERRVPDVIPDPDRRLSRLSLWGRRTWQALTGVDGEEASPVAIAAGASHRLLAGCARRTLRERLGDGADR
jgi:hypothetical protein